MKITRVWISPAALASVLGAGADEPASPAQEREEPCGLLLGHRVPLGAEIVQAVSVRNSHPSPARGFEMAPEDLVLAGRAGRAQGLDIVGFWHGHLAGPAWPGELDAEGVQLLRGDGLPPVVHLVVGRGTTGKRVVRAFREGRSRPKNVPLLLLGRPRGKSGRTLGGLPT
jgi:proteasome lid subunit RPN8/RPN11